jgi:hypothetical protein
MIPEIRLQICNEIYESDATLAAMAQSCRTFEEPALSILWRWLGSLKPVMGCLPGDLWAEQSGARTMVNLVDALTQYNIDDCSSAERRFLLIGKGFFQTQSASGNSTSTNKKLILVGS